MGLRKAGAMHVSMRAPLSAAAFGMMVAIAASSASAIPRTFVASSGQDTHACTRAQPCRGFAAALALTDAGGEIVVLDSAGYGPVTIDKSVSIVAPPGVYAGISVLSGDGIAINTPGVDVALKGLSINGQGGSNGIVVAQARSIVVERCTIGHFATDGITVNAAALVVVADSTSSGNAQNGITIAGGASAAITRARAEFNGAAGIMVTGGARATIDHSYMTTNHVNGLYVLQNFAGTTRVAVDTSVMTRQGTGSGILAASLGPSTFVVVDITRTTIAQNPYGIYVNSISGGATSASLTDSDIVDNDVNGITANNAPTVVRASGNRIMRNGGSGFAQSGGTIYTPATNYVRGNGTDDGGHVADSLL